MRNALILSFLAVLPTLAACGGDGGNGVTEPTGSLQVTVATTGEDLDSDGYRCSLDGGASRAVAVNGQTTFTGLDGGNHSVELTDIADNCTVSGTNPHNVTVTAGATAQTTFQVSCEALGPTAWTTKSPMPTGRSALATAVVGGKVYAFSAWNPTVTVEEYDPATDTWTTKQDMPAALEYPSASVVDGKVYVIGSVYEGASAVEVYDPATDTWETKAPPPFEVVAACAGVVNDKIYLFGGYGDPAPRWERDHAYEYDPATDSWTQKSDMPTARSGPGCAVVADKIYVIGGTTYEPFVSVASLDVYDPATDSWVTGSSMPTARAFFCATAVDGTIYAIGGTRNGDQMPSTPANEAYDTATGNWTQQADMPIARTALACSAVGTDIYAIGGSLVASWSQSSLRIVEAFDTQSGG